MPSSEQITIVVTMQVRGYDKVSSFSEPDPDLNYQILKHNIRQLDNSTERQSCKYKHGYL